MISASRPAPALPPGGRHWKAIGTAKANVKITSRAGRPRDNIERAVKKGCGDLDGDQFEEILYEGYGVGGVAVLLEALTDNRNRTAPEIRKLFEVNSGKLGSSNCVAWMFERKGLFVVDATEIDEETLMELAMNAGADDIKDDNDAFHLTCEVESYAQLSEALEQAEVPVSTKQITQVPTNIVDIGGEDARKVLKLLEALDEHDDVQNVSANFNIPDEVLAEITES